MRWRRKTKKLPALNQTRTEIRFALFPTKVADHWVWLEKFGESQKYQTVKYKTLDCFDDGCGDCGTCFTEIECDKWVVENRWLI